LLTVYLIKAPSRDVRNFIFLAMFKSELISLLQDDTMSSMDKSMPYVFLQAIRQFCFKLKKKGFLKYTSQIKNYQP